MAVPLLECPSSSGCRLRLIAMTREIIAMLLLLLLLALHPLSDLGYTPADMTAARVCSHSFSRITNRTSVDVSA